MKIKGPQNFYHLMVPNAKEAFWVSFTNCLLVVFTFWLGISVQDIVADRNAKVNARIARIDYVKEFLPKYEQLLSEHYYTYLYMQNYDDRERLGLTVDPIVFTKEDNIFSFTESIMSFVSSINQFFPPQDREEFIKHKKDFLNAFIICRCLISNEFDSLQIRKSLLAEITHPEHHNVYVDLIEDISILELAQMIEESIGDTRDLAKAGTMGGQLSMMLNNYFNAYKDNNLDQVEESYRYIIFNPFIYEKLYGPCIKSLDIVKNEMDYPDQQSMSIINNRLGLFGTLILSIVVLACIMYFLAYAILQIRR